jgi:O-antigen/teichoic acid export membrane protein
VLLLANRSGQVSIAMVGSAAVNLGLNLFIIPRFGIDGAAIVTLCSFSLQAAALGYFAAGTGRLPHLELWLLGPTFGAIALAVASSAIPVTPLAIVVRVLLALLAGGMFAVQIITFVAPQRFGTLIGRTGYLPLLRLGLTTTPNAPAESSAEQTERSGDQQ